MFTLALYVVGIAVLVIAGIAWLVAGDFASFLPEAAFGGLFLVIALAIERWRYKHVRVQHPDPRWTDTGERFVDPETGRLTAVYFDPDKGERHYLVAPESR